jgi:CheY-like chemotaxis protein
MTVRQGPVLIVDDDDDVRDLMAIALTFNDYAVRTASDGLEAIDLLAGGLRPKIILLDMMMPRLDGEAVVAALRRSRELSKIPVILVSGDSRAKQKAAELHAAGCLVKPFELDELLTAVRHAVT